MNINTKQTAISNGFIIYLMPLAMALTQPSGNYILIGGVVLRENLASGHVMLARNMT